VQHTLTVKEKLLYKSIGLSHARPNSGISGDLLSENEANPVVI